MNAAVVKELGKLPVYGDFAEPRAEPGEVLVHVTAAALSPLTRNRAVGRHYSARGGVPFVPGVDGVGRLDSGARVYFALPRHPYGAMAETTTVEAGHCVPLRDELDDVTAAAIANPGMSCWAALKERARMAPGESVLVNGATGSAGRMAVQSAKYLGARKVIATGRDAGALEGLAALGADVTISLAQPAETLAKMFREQFSGDGVDIVLDYLWGESAQRLLAAASGSGETARRVRYVEIGSVSGEEISLDGAVLRSSGLELMGSGIGSVAGERLIAVIGELLQAVVPAHLTIETATFPLADVEKVWASGPGKQRAVFKIGG